MGTNEIVDAGQEISRHVEIGGNLIVVVGVLVLFLGEFITRHVTFLREINIPTPVTGGLICSVAIAVLAAVGGVNVDFDLTLRDSLLLVFFSTIGLGARLETLATAGKALGILLVACTVFLVLQDVTGIAVALIAGEHPAYGLLGGSVSFAGGHGTAIAWGQEARNAGLEGAAEFGIACATLGLIVGGLVGGPVAGRLIARHGLREQADAAKLSAEPQSEERDSTMSRVTVNDAIGTILALAICVGLGDIVNRFLFARDIKLPGFLTAMMVGILLTNLVTPLKFRLSKPTIDLVSGVSLQLFLTMSLMSMDLVSLAASASFLLMIVIAQMLAVTFFSTFVIFRIMGRDYDAAVISGGFVGMGLGATPVAIANMDAITRKYGTSAKAFLVVPLVGAFFIDIANAVVIKSFLRLSLFQ